jgi:hypothetical protein
MGARPYFFQPAEGVFAMTATALTFDFSAIPVPAGLPEKAAAFARKMTGDSFGDIEDGLSKAGDEAPDFLAILYWGGRASLSKVLLGLRRQYRQTKSEQSRLMILEAEYKGELFRVIFETVAKAHKFEWPPK